MKSLTLKLAPFIFIGFFLLSYSKGRDGVYFNESSEVFNSSKVSYSELETEILILVNDYREKLGLTSLICMDIVSSVANEHTTYMIEKGEISHDNFGKRFLFLKENVNAKSVGENVAFGYTSAQSVFDGWLNSDAHRKIIETSGFTHFGIATKTCGKGYHYFTHIFIKKTSMQSPRNKRAVLAI